jgi:2-aminoadipate transaminase
MTTPIPQRYSKTAQSMEHSFIREILKMTKGVKGMISFAGGLPSPDSFPKEILARLFSEVVAREGEAVLQYGASDGDAELKKVLIELEGVPELSDDRIIITAGSTNAIYYYTRTLIDPGDFVICEAPGFPGSLAAMEACGARFAGVEMDDSGMRPEKLEETLRQLNRQNKPVKFIYVIPEFQNPSGRTMDVDRRRVILDIAKAFDLLILEDQPYRELRFEGEPIPTLWEIAETEFGDPDRVTITKSFSKILGPGIRLGHTMASADIISPMVKWAQKITVSPDCTTQRVGARFIQAGYLSGQIEKIRSLYTPRRDAMLAALEQHMPADVRWTRPQGGMFIWVTMGDRVDTDLLLKQAVEKQVAFIPGSKFYPPGTVKKNELRLNFSYSDETQIREGIRRLASLI